MNYKNSTNNMRIKVWQHWNMLDFMKIFRPSTKLLDLYAHIVGTGTVLY